MTFALLNEEKPARLRRNAKDAMSLYKLSWGTSRGSSGALYGARALIDSITWLIAHLAFENLEQAEGLFRDMRAEYAQSNLDWLEPANDPRLYRRSPTAYASGDTVGYVFEYTPYGLATEYQPDEHGKAKWRNTTQAVYRTRARDFRRLLKKMHRAGLAIAHSLRSMSQTVCKHVAATLRLFDSSCDDTHTELMRLTMNVS